MTLPVGYRIETPRGCVLTIVTLVASCWIGLYAIIGGFHAVQMLGMGDYVTGYLLQTASYLLVGLAAFVMLVLSIVRAATPGTSGRPLAVIVGVAGLALLGVLAGQAIVAWFERAGSMTDDLWIIVWMMEIATLPLMLIGLAVLLWVDG